MEKTININTSIKSILNTRALYDNKSTVNYFLPLTDMKKINLNYIENKVLNNDNFKNKDFFLDFLIELIINYFLEVNQSSYKRNQDFYKILQFLDIPTTDFDFIKNKDFSNSKMCFIFPILIRIYINTNNKYVLNYIFEKILNSKIAFVANRIYINNIEKSDIENESKIFLLEKIKEIKDEIDKDIASKKISDLCNTYIFLKQRIKDHITSPVKNSKNTKFKKLADKISDEIYNKIKNRLKKDSNYQHLEEILKDEKYIDIEILDNENKIETILRDSVLKKVNTLVDDYNLSEESVDDENKIDKPYTNFLKKSLDDFLLKLKTCFKLEKLITKSEYKNFMDKPKIEFVDEINESLISKDVNDSVNENTSKSEVEEAIFNFYIKDSTSKKESQNNLDKLYIFYMKYILGLDNKKIKDYLPSPSYSESTIGAKIDDLNIDIMKINEFTSLDNYCSYLVSDNILFKGINKEALKVFFNEMINNKDNIISLTNKDDGTYKNIFNKLKEQDLINQYKLDKNTVTKIIKKFDDLDNYLSYYKNNEKSFVNINQIENELNSRNIKNYDIKNILEYSKIEKMNALESIVNTILLFVARKFEKDISQEIYKNDNSFENINRLKNEYREFTKGKKTKEDFLELLKDFIELKIGKNNKINDIIKNIEEISSKLKLKSSFEKNISTIYKETFDKFFQDSVDYLFEKINLTEDQKKNVLILNFENIENSNLEGIFYLFTNLTNENNLSLLENNPFYSYVSNEYKFPYEEDLYKEINENKYERVNQIKYTFTPPDSTTKNESNKIYEIKFESISEV